MIYLTTWKLLLSCGLSNFIAANRRAINYSIYDQVIFDLQFLICTTIQFTYQHSHTEWDEFRFLDPTYR